MDLKTILSHCCWDCPIDPEYISNVLLPIWAIIKESDVVQNIKGCTSDGMTCRYMNTEVQFKE